MDSYIRVDCAFRHSSDWRTLCGYGGPAGSAYARSEPEKHLARSLIRRFYCFAGHYHSIDGQEALSGQCLFRFDHFSRRHDYGWNLPEKYPWSACRNSEAEERSIWFARAVSFCGGIRFPHRVEAVSKGGLPPFETASTR